MNTFSNSTPSLHDALPLILQILIQTINRIAAISSMPFHIRTPSPKNNSSPTRRPCSAHYKVGGTILDAFTHPFYLDNSQKKSLHLRGSAVKIQMRVSAFPSKGGP